MKQYLKKNLVHIILLFLYTVVAAVFISFIPLTTKYLIENCSNLDTTKITILVGIYILSVLLFLFFEYIKKIQAAKIHKLFNLQLREDLFLKTLTSRHSELIKYENSDIINILINDIDTIYSDYFSCYIELFQSILSFLVYFIIMMIIDWKLSLVIIAVCLISLFIPKLVGKDLSIKEVAASNKEASLIKKVDEINEGRAFFTHKTKASFFQQFKFKNIELESSVYKLSKSVAFSQIFSGFSLYIINIAAFITGIVFIFCNLATLGSFIAIVAYIDCISVPTRDIVFEIITINATKGLRDKICQILSIEQLKENEDYVPFEELKVEHLCFEYDDINLFNDLSFEIKKKSKNVITGKNGSGKSTLIKILTQEINGFGGEITINGLKFENASFFDFGFYVPINNPIFEGSLEENITLFNSYNFIVKKEIETLKLSHLLDRHIEAGGKNISSGEIGKIQILRAINSGKDLLVFDEIFANIDAKSEKELTDYLLGLNQTIILISHNLDSEYLSRFDKNIKLS